MKTVGQRHWTHGPLILGSKKLYTAVLKSFTKQQAKPLAALTKPVSLVKFGAETVLALATNEETGVVPWGKQAAVLVHAREDQQNYLLEGDRVAAIASIDPRTIPAAAWKPVGQLELPKDAVLFDIHSRDVTTADKKATLPIKLPADRYVIDVATGTAKAKPYPSKIVTMTYTFVRLRPPDWQVPVATTEKEIVDEGPVIASPEVIAGAKKLKVADCDGIPMMVVPEKHLAAWKGIGDDDDSEDYDRACEVEGVATIKVGKGKGLVISEPGNMMWWPTKTGGLLVIWLGADSNAGCIAAALSIPDNEFEKQRTKLVVEKGAEEHVIFESGAAGNTRKANGKIGWDDSMSASFKLAAGTYAIAAVWSWEARVKVGKKIEDTMIGAIRLTRV